MKKLLNKLNKAGRKYQFGLYCLLILLGAFVYSIHHESTNGLFINFTGGVVAIFITYTGGNVSSKHVNKKLNKKKEID